MLEADPAIAHVVAGLVINELAYMVGSDRLSMVTHHQAYPAKFFLCSGASSRPHIVIILFAQRQSGAQIGSLLLRNHDITGDERGAQLVFGAHCDTVWALRIDHGDE